MQPRTVGRLLASDPGLSAVVAKALEIKAISRRCVDYFPPELGSRIRAVNLKDGKLVVLASSAAAAAKLKLLAEGLQESLTRQGAKVNSVSVRVQPGDAPTVVAAPQQPPRLSAAGLRALNTLYERLPDSPARRALKLLLEHHARDAGAADAARR